MGETYVAVDSGKYGTKMAVYDVEKGETKKFCFRTKISDGFFEDDAIETATFIAEIDGKVYKIGNGAKQQATLETSKKTETHKITTLAAIAMVVNPHEVDNVHVAIGIPVNEFAVVSKRNEYREYILPDGEIEVKLKTKNEQDPETIKFKIVTKLVCPESSGVLYLNPVKYKNSTTGVLDIGNLNLNGTYWNGFDLDSDYNITDELGGNILISGLSQLLSAEFSRCDENKVASILMKPKEERMLVPTHKNIEVEERSKEIITNFLLQHVREIRRRCDTKHWSLDYMDLVFIGGTTKLLKNEIIEVFGEEVTIAEEGSYANVLGFLTKLCSRCLNILIPTAKDEVNKLAEPEKIA
ncbi:MAG: ParM/StbA family protein [Lachnospiraceae bacterium]|nr:ParM/StbA family protein [Lachnospiraceae bacterium]